MSYVENLPKKYLSSNLPKYSLFWSKNDYLIFILLNKKHEYNLVKDEVILKDLVTKMSVYENDFTEVMIEVSKEFLNVPLNKYTLSTAFNEVTTFIGRHIKDSLKYTDPTIVLNYMEDVTESILKNKPKKVNSELGNEKRDDELELVKLMRKYPKIVSSYKVVNSLETAFTTNEDLLKLIKTQNENN